MNLQELIRNIESDGYKTKLTGTDSSSTLKLIIEDCPGNEFIIPETTNESIVHIFQSVFELGWTGDYDDLIEFYEDMQIIALRMKEKKDDE